MRRALFALLFAAGCGGAPLAPVDAGVEDDSVPDLASGCQSEHPTCPDVDMAPSFTNDVAPIIEHYCFPCHDTGGVEKAHLFTDWQHIEPQVGEMLTQVESCNMPPFPAPVPDEQTRVTLLTWLACGGPNN